MFRIRLLILLSLLSITCISGQENNPFDIQRSASDTVIVDNKESTDTNTDAPINKLNSENPFSVSHIPIRKNQYKQIEQLTPSVDKGKESISIGYLPLWMIIFSLSLLAFIIFKKKDHIYTLIRSMFNANYMKLKAYEESSGLTLVYVLGYFLFVINMALFLFFLWNGWLGIGKPFSYYKVFLLCAAFFFGKHIIIAMFSTLFETQKESSIYAFTISSFYNVLAIIFLAINILLLFGPDTWIKPMGMFGFFIFITGLMSRYYKGLGIGRKYLNDHFFHFFLYFCAFEFSPWLLVYSLMRDFI